MDREEVVGVSAARELHASGLVGRVYHRKLPEESTALLVRVVAVALGHHRRVHAVPETGNVIVLNFDTVVINL